MPFAKRALLALKRIAIVIGIAVAFSLGLLSAIYLSLRSSETRVPDVIGKDRASAENTISDAGLNFRVRATRATSEARPDTVLIQLPRAGEIVKVGQTVAVDISRPTKEGESSTTTPTSNTNSGEDAKSEATENRNSQASANDNKPKRRPTNANANDANANRSAARNRNTNENRAFRTTENVNRAAPAINGNRTGENANKGATNANRRPIIMPTP